MASISRSVATAASNGVRSRARYSAPARFRLQQTSRIQPLLPRHYATKPVKVPEGMDAGERKVFDMINKQLQPTELEVQDISGGCGSMYQLNIVSEQFRGLTTIKQHRLVNKMLGDEIKQWHGVRMNTKAPS